MPTNAEKSVETLKKFIGQPDEPGEYLAITQERINQFAECTIDHQFIHVDPERSAQMSPFKVTIAHGFLTLSMLTYLASSVKMKYPEAYEGVMMGVNYGFDKVRFVSPVKVGSKIRLQRKLIDAQLKSPNQVLTTSECTIEIEGETKPACIAQWLTMMVFA